MHFASQIYTTQENFTFLYTEKSVLRETKHETLENKVVWQKTKKKNISYEKSVR